MPIFHIRNRILKHRRGFTLVELVVSVGTLAIAGVIMIQVFMGAKGAAQRAEDLDRSVFLSNRIIESVKSERWDDPPLSAMKTNVDIPGDTGYVITKTGYYDAEMNSIREPEELRTFETTVTMRSEDSVENGKTLLYIDVEIVRLEPYYSTKVEKPVVYSVDTKVYIDTPVEVIHP